MLDAKFIRDHVDELTDTIERQKKPELLDVLKEFLALDSEWRAVKSDLDKLRSERNSLSEEINTTKKAGGDIQPIVSKAKEIPKKIEEKETNLSSLQKDIDELRSKIPNIMHADVPYGESDKDNPEVEKWEVPKQFDFDVKNHVELCESLNISDFEASGKTTGTGFYFLKGDLGLLNQALIRFAIDKLTEKGYVYVEPPLMVRQPVLEAAMDMEAIKQSVYKVQEHDDEAADPEQQLCMIGTAEHAILGMHWDEILVEDELPKKYAGYSMCMRAEIGSHGINEKGLWRTHQFNKVEQFVFCTPEQSQDIYDELYKNSAEILQALDLPYRVVEICTGDLAKWKSRSHDFEVWRPTTKSYGEVMSLSNCTTYQASDLNIRYKKRDGKTGIVHTLNNTALATSRIMVAILENYQEEDGSVGIPEVLRQYMNGKEKLSPIEKVEKY